MIYAALAAAPIALLVAGSIAAVAEQPLPPDGLDLGSTLETASVEAIIEEAPASPTFDLDDLAVEPAAPGDADMAWAEEAPSGVAYPVTDRISLGVDYEHEEIEDLTAERIAMGSAGVDYTSHKVLVRAQWMFDLIP